MKTTKTICDNCGGDRFGGPNLSMAFPNWKKITVHPSDILYSITAQLFENPHMGGARQDVDICENCKIDAIIKLGEILKEKKDKSVVALTE